MQDIRRCQRANLFTYPVAHLGIERGGRLFTVVQGDVSVDGLAFNIVWNAHHRGFGDFWVGDQRRFNLRGPQSVAGNVQHVVHAAGYPVIAIFIAARAIATKVHVLEG